MRWMDGIGEAVSYIEENITQQFTIEDVAAKALISPFYFQKGFSMLCGFTVAEYIRCRRLALAGSELVATDRKIIDIAMKYGYDSPDSFTKSFVRFHGATPTAVRKGGATVKSFAPLKIKFALEGGYSMEYKVVEKGAFTVVGLSKVFGYENAKEEIPKLWAEVARMGEKGAVCGKYGISIDESMGGDEFEYLIADDYTAGAAVLAGFITKTIPAFSWAVFTCRGPMPQAIQGVNEKIYSEWLPACRDYEIAAGYCVEMYDDPAQYPKGVLDESYYSEMWVPVKRK